MSKRKSEALTFLHDGGEAVLRAARAVRAVPPFESKLKAALEHAQLGAFAQGDHDARIVLAHLALPRHQARDTVADHVHGAVTTAGEGGGAQLMQEGPGEERENDWDLLY